MDVPGSLRLLVVDDERDVRLGLKILAESVGAEVREADSGEAAIAVVEMWTPHVVISDISMGGMSGVEFLGFLARRFPAIREILITGFGSVELAVEAMRRGAVDFITKPFDNEEILASIRRYGEAAMLEEKTRRMSTDAENGSFHFIAEDPRMKAVFDLIDQVAPTTMSVLIQGESGSGKELVAKAIHQAGNHSQAPFLAVNSAALPDTLLESELFGHRKGAFTGADQARQGIFAKADGGTVFLDEIALMSPAFQGKLLRVLQERTVIPLGSSTAIPVDFRLIAATGKNLQDRIEAGEFREDLYYRLRVVTIDLPRLKDRPGDIVPLAEHFLVKYAGQVATPGGRVPRLSADALAALKRHEWKGNVRELENCIQRGPVLSGGNEIQESHLRLDDDAGPWAFPELSALSYEEGKQQALKIFQLRFIERALSQTGGNVTHAADRCGLTRAAFQRIMRALDVDRDRFLS